MVILLAKLWGSALRTLFRHWGYQQQEKGLKGLGGTEQEREDWSSLEILLSFKLMEMDSSFHRLSY